MVSTAAAAATTPTTTVLLGTWQAALWMPLLPDRLPTTPLLSQHDEHHKRQRHARGSRSPGIQNLPNEILIHIFSFLIGSTSHCTDRRWPRFDSRDSHCCRFVPARERLIESQVDRECGVKSAVLRVRC